MQDDSTQVFVPSVEENDGNIVGLGIFSTQEIAEKVLKDFFKQSWRANFTTATITMWEMDIIGQDGAIVFGNWSCQECPICERTTFWMDLENFNALCYTGSCGAWIEDNPREPDIIDCGFPVLRFMHQSRSVEDALLVLGKLGAKLRVAGAHIATPILAPEEAKVMLSEFEDRAVINSEGSTETLGE